MKTTSQTPQDASAPADATYTTDTAAYTMLLHRNVARLANLQKTTLDMLSNQTADLAETMRDSLKTMPAEPAAAFLNFAAHGMESWVNAQKNILDLIVQQSAHTAEVAEQRSGYAAQSVSKMNELVQQCVERTAAAQKSMLDFAARQNAAAIKAFQGQAAAVGLPADKIAESMEQGVASFINTQKEFLDTATQITREAAAAKAAGKS